ncbi:hypothetical protein FOA52_000830 [Chlamydomonas sp. UWO 241]|nr:hypothetical protein FOA52_000830 [Chlamydomonas sp. UWO 241]
MSATVEEVELDAEELKLMEEEGGDAMEDDDQEEPEDQDEEEDEAGAVAAIAKAEKLRLKQRAQAKRDMAEKLKFDTGSAESCEAARGKSRMQFLLKQAEIFQHFASPDAGSSKTAKGGKKGRHAHDEEDEDAQLLKDEEEGGDNAGHRVQAQPSLITGGTLREYQLQGLNWMIHLYDNGVNGILADEMGLGKTLQTISLIAYLREFRGINGPHLIIVPKSTLGNWCNEFKKFCPIIRVTKFIGPVEERERLKQTSFAPGKFDAVVTSYEMIIKEKAYFRKFFWRYVIIDEAHRIKNENSRLSLSIRLLRTNYRLLITGTPLQNNLHELWALLNFLLPEVFSSAEKFDDWFSLGDGGKEKEAEVVGQLHKVLRPFLLRRIKSDVEKSLPPKKETILKIGMTEMQRKWYAGLLQKDVEALQGGADRGKLLNVVMQLRKCCNHPYLFEGAEEGPPYIPGDHIVTNSGKMILLDKLLPKLQERGSRVLIFSQMTRMLDILEDYCLMMGMQYCRIDGNTSTEEREEMIDSYNKPGSEKFVFLLSTRAGGLGINLWTADIVVLFDSDWNPQMDLQAMDRAHRIGQKKEVHVYRFCTDMSIEEKVIEKAYKKLRLDALVIQQGRLTENSAKVNKDDLLSMVRYGAELIFSGTAGVTDADIDAIIAKGESETKALNDKMNQFTNDAMKFSMDGGVGDYKDKDEDEGVPDLDFKTIAASNWVDPPERKRKKVVNYNENDYFRGGQGSKAGKEKSKGPKMPTLADYQFYDAPRLNALFQKAIDFDQWEVQCAQKLKQMQSQGASDAAIEAAMKGSDNDPTALTPEEEAEKERLLGEGFSNWMRRDFHAFVRGCEKYGRDALALVAAEVEGKTEEEVREYAKVFWSRGESELNDWEKVSKTIERGEQRLKRMEDNKVVIAEKLRSSKNPWTEIKLSYGQAKGKQYTEEEDRFLLCMTHQLGYGAWDELKAEVRASARFRFDWFLKSRLPAELGRRVDALIRLIEKEAEDGGGKDDGDEAKGEKKGKDKKKSKGDDKEEDKKTSKAGSEEPSSAGGGKRRTLAALNAEASERELQASAKKVKLV